MSAHTSKSHRLREEPYAPNSHKDKALHWPQTQNEIFRLFYIVALAQDRYLCHASEIFDILVESSCENNSIATHMTDAMASGVDEFKFKTNRFVPAFTSIPQQLNTTRLSVKLAEIAAVTGLLRIAAPLRPVAKTKFQCKEPLATRVPSQIEGRAQPGTRNWQWHCHSGITLPSQPSGSVTRAHRHGGTMAILSAAAARAP